MNFDFLTPEIFDMLVITNLIVALLLITFRFYQDMTHKQAESQEYSHAHDDSTHASLADTDLSHFEAVSAETTPQERNTL